MLQRVRLSTSVPPLVAAAFQRQFVLAPLGLVLFWAHSSRVSSRAHSHIAASLSAFLLVALQLVVAEPAKGSV